MRSKWVYVVYVVEKVDLMVEVSVLVLVLCQVVSCRRLVVTCGRRRR